jgi:hypothetical protein
MLLFYDRKHERLCVKKEEESVYVSAPEKTKQ